MSRVIQNVASVRFEINARPASATMRALEEEAKGLNDAMADVNKKIESLGKVAPDDQRLIDYRKQLKDLKSDLDDVNKTIKDYTRGVKAADALLAAAETGTIEKMSMKAIKAGANGLRKRIENIQPDTLNAEELKSYRIIKQVIEEADGVVNKFKTDAAGVIQTLRDGGTVSERAMKQARDGVKSLMESYEEGSKEYREFAEQYEFLAAKVIEFGEAQRRAAGEIVTVDDAMKKANATSKKAAQTAADKAKFEKDEYAELKKEAEAKAQASKQKIDNINGEIAATKESIEAKKKELATVDEQLAKSNELKEAIKQGYELRMKLAEAKDEWQAKFQDLNREKGEWLKLNDEVVKATVKVEELQEELQALGEKKVTPKVDTSEIDALRQKLEGILSEKSSLSAKAIALRDNKGYSSVELDERNLYSAIQAYNKELGGKREDLNSTLKSGFNSGETRFLEILAAQIQGTTEDAQRLILRLQESKSELKLFSGVHGEFQHGLQNVILDPIEKGVNAFKKNEEALTELRSKQNEYLSEKITLESRYNELQQEEGKTRRQIAEAERNATQAETKSVKELEQELDMLNKRQKEKEEWLKMQEGYLNDSLKELEQMGIAEADIADESKVREAAEKKVLEIMEAEKKVAHEIAEQRRELSSKVTSSQLGGTKADQEFYAKNKDLYNTDYNSVDDVMDRIAHLEMVSKLKNGKRFSDETTWDPDDELDESEAIIMTDKERQYAKEELRILKQHLREKILKAFHEVGDIDKAIEEVTGGDGFSEDSKFGEQLNDKIQAIKEKINGQIKTSLDAYEELVEPNRSDIDGTLNKEGLAKDIRRHILNVGEEISSGRDEVQWAKDDVQEVKEEIAAKKQEIELAKQQKEATQEETQATQEATQADEKRLKIKKDLEQAQTALTQAEEKADAQNQKVEAANQALLNSEEKQKKIKEELNNLVGGRDFDKEEEKLSETIEKHEELTEAIGAEEKKHEELTEQMEQEQQVMEKNNEAAKSYADQETEAAIQLAQAQNQSQEAYESALSVLEKVHRQTNEGTNEYNEQAEAIDKLKEKLGQMKGELMSLEEAKKLAGQAGTDGFFATHQMMNQAVQAIERRRAAIIKTIRTQQDAGKETKREEEELKQLDKVLKDLKFEQDNLNMSQEKMRMLMKQPTEAVSLDELRGAIKRADGELKRMEGSLGKNSKQYKEFDADVKQAKNVLKDMEGQAKATSSAWDKAWSRLKTYVGMYMGFNMLWQKMTGTMDDMMTLSDKMGEVRKTTGFTADEVGRLSDNLAKLDTRTNLTGLMEFSSLAGSIGLKTQEAVQGFTEAANMIAVSLPEMGNEASRTLMKIADATGDLEKNGGNVRETLERVGSTIIALRANSAAAAGPITDFVSRVGAVGAQAGISIDQIAALGATVDALGGRVEMSATALSRMIPAIKNNSFAVAQAIGMTEKELKGKTGMEQMVAIFRALHDSVKGFDTSTEEGMNAMADSVEKALGRSTSMQDVMKQLNQQGARAGIVFGLLSQNVDTLEDQLRTAGEAYENNTALLNEYNKMNDTTAAKWERLKNQLEEAFVSDGMQRFLGSIISGLRTVVDLLTGDDGLSGALRFIVAYFAIFKAKWAEAIGQGIIATGKYIWSMRASAIAAEADAAAKSADTAATVALGTATEDTTKKTNLFAGAWGKLSNAMKANIITAVAMGIVYLGTVLWDAHKAAAKAAEALRQVHENTEKEKDAVSELFKPLKDANLQHDEKVKLIKAINSQYGTYLSKMLTEASNAQEIARAYEAINLQLERKNILEGMESNKKDVQDKYKGALDSAYNEMDKAIGKAASSDVSASRISSYISKKVSEAIENGMSGDELRKSIQKELGSEISSGKMKQYVQIISGGQSRRESAGEYIAYAAKRYYDAQMKVQGEVKTANKRLQADMDNIVGKVREAADKDIPTLISDLDKALGKGKDAKKYTAKESSAVVEAFDSIKAYYDLHREDLSDEQRKQIEAKLGTDIKGFRQKANAGGGGGGGGNVYGDYDKVKSPYSKWNGNDLVARRKEMLERVKALANGADVQAVLSEDAKFISDAVRKNIKTTEQAIEWYNTERLKIQDALHAKHLTNTGDWLDPKKGSKRARKVIDDEMKYYMDELDAYYTERKAKIQEAQNDEEISEAEARNRTLANEAEWRQRRAELQQLYAKKSEKVTKEEQDAIFNILSERTGESVGFIQKDIAQTVKFIEKIGLINKATMDRILGDLDKDIETDFLRQRNAIGKHMKAIQDIIDKERPFNGITKNLNDNLTTMGILTGHMQKEMEELMAKNADMTDFNNRQAEETFKELTFLLQEAEHAYSTTAEDVMRRAADAGLTAWVDEMKKNPEMQDGMMAQLRSTYDVIQDAIKKEASQMKKQAEIMWNNILLPGGDGKTVKTVKDVFEKAISQLGIDQGRVSRANSLIGAGQASERVADKLAIKQMQLQLTMQQHYYNLMRKQGMQRIEMLDEQIKKAKEANDLEKAKRLEMDKQHVTMSLNLAMTKEQNDLLKQQEDIIAKTEESQNRLYSELREWADLLTSGIQSVMEANAAGSEEYYNELAKLNLTGKGGPGAGTYVIIDNAGTSDATAHYEYLDERQALEREREIERENAVAEAWEKMWDDLNMKLSETITDQLNAMLQNQSIDANTDATLQNTEALMGLSSAIDTEVPSTGRIEANGSETWNLKPGANAGLSAEDIQEWKDALGDNPMDLWMQQSNLATQKMVDNNKKIQQSTQTTFAKMTLAANMYGAAYQAMSNDNLSMTQKFEMMALQAVGNYAIGALTTEMASASAKAATDSPGVLGTLWKQLGWAAAPVFAIFTGLLGGLMGLATSKVGKAKSTIAQATGTSVGAGRLATGMLTYAEGNVNEFTDPNSLTPGRSYNVDGADGKTYRAKYMGANPKTHLTNGAEFHLVGEKGREAIIDAHTTRLMQMDDTGIWKSIQTLYNGGTLSALRRRRSQRGVKAFADGNLEDFDDMIDGGSAENTGLGGIGMEQMAAFQASLDRNSAIMERLAEDGIEAFVSPYGKRGIVNGYDTYKKEAKRHGEKHL